MFNFAWEHSTLLQQKYHYYFFTVNTEQHDCIRKQYAADAETATKKMSLHIRDNLLKVRNDRTISYSAKFHLMCFFISIE